MLDLPARETRHNVSLDAAVRRSGGIITSHHRVHNLSSGGACITNGADFRIGETITANVGLLIAVSATVRWIDGGLAGLSFAYPIDVDAAQLRGASLGQRRKPPGRSRRPLE